MTTIAHEVKALEVYDALLDAIYAEQERRKQEAERPIGRRTGKRAEKGVDY